MVVNNTKNDNKIISHILVVLLDDPFVTYMFISQEVREALNANYVVPLSTSWMSKYMFKDENFHVLLGNAVRYITLVGKKLKDKNK